MDDRIKYVRIIDGIIMIVLFSLTACSKQSDFDAKSYVKNVRVPDTFTEITN